jgi:hypothetical protein
VQPCGESCGSNAEFAFLTIELIQIENKSYFLVTESIPLVSTMFYAWEVPKNMSKGSYAESCRAQKHLQKDPKKKAPDRAQFVGAGGGI